jgi:DNA-directed RNA polymerase specialized sigma24 family protein
VGGTRVKKNSVRLDPEEALEAIIKDQEAAIAADQHEVDILETALDYIRDDPYYKTVSGRYFDGLDNETIGEKIGCDGTTVWRNRQRLVKSLAVRLYGTTAID